MVPVYCELCMEVNMDTNNLLGGKKKVVLETSQGATVGKIHYR